MNWFGQVLRLSLSLAVASLLAAKEKLDLTTVVSGPKVVGARDIVLEFETRDQGRQGNSRIISSEAPILDSWAASLIWRRELKPGSPGVTKIGKNRYRAVLSFPIEGDEPILARDKTLPTPLSQPNPDYPAVLRKDGSVGGAILKLTIDSAGKLTETELVRASHPEFGPAALEAVRKWTFAKPATQAGKPIEITLFQLISFELRRSQPRVEIKRPDWRWIVSPEPALPRKVVSDWSLFRIYNAKP
jgi:TonB family protein